MLVLVVACAPPPQLRRHGWVGDAGDITELLRGDYEALLGLGDLTAEAQLTVGDPQGRHHSASGAVLFRAPDLLRLDVRGPLFQRLLTAVIDADTLVALVGEQHVRLPARDGLDTFLDIDLGGYDPRWALLGVVVPPAASAPSEGGLEIVYPRADRAVVLSPAEAPVGRRRLWLDLHHGFVDREEILDDTGAVLWTRTLRRYRRLPGTDVYLPRAVRIEGNDRLLLVEYGKVRVNRDLPREAFYSGLR